jgi:hypothetical protein
VKIARLMCNRTAALFRYSPEAPLGPQDAALQSSSPLFPPPPTQFKTHNAVVPNGLTSSRSIENAPAFRFRVVLEAHCAGAFPIQP